MFVVETSLSLVGRAELFVQWMDVLGLRHMVFGLVEFSVGELRKFLGLFVVL